MKVFNRVDRISFGGGGSVTKMRLEGGVRFHLGGPRFWGRRPDILLIYRSVVWYKTGGYVQDTATGFCSTEPSGKLIVFREILAKTAPEKPRVFAAPTLSHLLRESLQRQSFHIVSQGFF
jgi:hypothetical protein